MPKTAASPKDYNVVGQTSDGVEILRPKMSTPRLARIKRIVEQTMKTTAHVGATTKRSVVKPQAVRKKR